MVISALEEAVKVILYDVLIGGAVRPRTKRAALYCQGFKAVHHHFIDIVADADLNAPRDAAQVAAREMLRELLPSSPVAE